MIAESDTKEAVLLEKDRMKALKHDVMRLFMDFENADPDPKVRVKNAQEKIDEARKFLSALMESYPAIRRPVGRFQEIHELFSALEASCKKAEERMERFKNVRLRGKRASSF